MSAAARAIGIIVGIGGATLVGVLTPIKPIVPLVAIALAAVSTVVVLFLALFQHGKRLN